MGLIQLITTTLKNDDSSQHIETNRKCLRAVKFNSGSGWGKRHRQLPSFIYKGLFHDSVLFSVNSGFWSQSQRDEERRFFLPSLTCQADHSLALSLMCYRAYIFHSAWLNNDSAHISVDTDVSNRQIIHMSQESVILQLIAQVLGTDQQSAAALHWWLSLLDLVINNLCISDTGQEGHQERWSFLQTVLSTFSNADCFLSWTGMSLLSVWMLLWITLSLFFWISAACRHYLGVSMCCELNIHPSLLLEL